MIPSKLLTRKPYESLLCVWTLVRICISTEKYRGICKHWLLSLTGWIWKIINFYIMHSILTLKREREREVKRKREGEGENQMP